MSERSTHHATFVIERSYAATPARVFGAWADPTAKASWFHGPGEWQDEGYELDFRVGGREHLRTSAVGGEAHSYDCRYYDIVPGQRIVYCYDMFVGERRISVSLATVEFSALGSGARMIFTEQAVFLDGYDDAGQRERGTVELFDRLRSVLG